MLIKLNEKKAGKRKLERKTVLVQLVTVVVLLVQVLTQEAQVQNLILSLPHQNKMLKGKSLSLRERLMKSQNLIGQTDVETLKWQEI